MEDEKQQKKKKANAPTALGFGKGTRSFFDYLLLTQYESVEDFLRKVDPLTNKEIDSLLSEILEQRNEERRRPKCPKGTRDMDPT